MDRDNPFARTADYSLLTCALVLGCLAVLSIALLDARESTSGQRMLNAQSQAFPVQGKDSYEVRDSSEASLIRYGRDLIAHTATYLGPAGKVASISNGMNCQNCHLVAGTKAFGNNYRMVASTYPRFRARSGTIESVEKRINDCIERSLNGKPLADSSMEMRAMKAYILWVGRDVPRGSKVEGAGLGELPFLDRAANPAFGKTVFEKHCVRCHGPQGRGRKGDGNPEWLYPPLVGDSSYNVGAGLYRLSRFAAYVRNNMPDGTTYLNPVLSVEEAWDVAAYINSLPRPSKDLSKDWPDIATKPFDHPFGPYADSFTEQQHKYGPFASIKKK